ncbi:MAG: glycosyltransferase family 4 protein [candidate division NC10 bacterium]|nr:glycosyltransferase family 4 protein [candidate division NC10 bacterium]
MRHIVTGLDRRLFSPAVWCLAGGGDIAGEIRCSGTPVELFHMEARPSIGFVLALALRMRRTRVEIAHCHGYTACAVGRVAAVLARTPAIFAHVHSHGYHLQPRQRRFERLLSFATTKVLCVSESVRAFVVEHERISPSRTQVVYNGAPEPVLPDSTLARRRFGIADGMKVLGCVASLAPHKGHTVLLDAVRMAQEAIPNLVLLVVGDGPLRQELEQRACQAKVAAIFTGLLPNIGEALAAMDALSLLPPRQEGLSLALIEGMAASKPLIGAAVGGIPEVIRDGVNGLLCAPGDPTHAAACLVAVLGDSERARSMGEAGRKLYRERFTPQRMIADIEQLYRS